MTKNMLLVGCSYAGPPIADVNIDVLGLCRSSVDQNRSAYALYEYDVIIINPISYSHFIFGTATAHSESPSELWDLKSENNSFDLDTAYDQYDRVQELSAALEQGTRVIWLMAKEKHIKFFGRRSIYVGYANDIAKKVADSSILYEKKSRRLSVTDAVGEFLPYYERLQIDGWSMCLDTHGSLIESFANTPEGYTLGGMVAVGSAQGWMLTPPTTQDATDVLVRCALGLDSTAVPRSAYHGIFLSHTGADKPFVRELKARLEAQGVRDVWMDEAEILVGDSLTKKIDEGLKKTKYICVVLSSKSVKSPWVERELEIAIHREIATGEVVVLPLLYERCELPSFLIGKLYADFTSPDEYDEGVGKLLRRLKVS
ncbi:toll/interleukin-1 receptor domain-containing protein [Pseudomonas sivasensis]|uniref:toll/interleukin-1 receptor domain-containing protein n=1 Tax=Pseudomonas sivasensis TaxID=1880678 RepID=UPI0021A9F666|nr:toll/interleukin-1 receptor domain-containing protein [Pseudomonas sivasensis]MCT4500734.1 toll/interleukin-1 receptor domain-containing protein [Pseudomonas sivasensis]